MRFFDLVHNSLFHKNVFKPIASITLTEDVAEYVVSVDNNGNSFNLSEVKSLISSPAAASSSDIRCQINAITDGYANQSLSSSALTSALSVGLLNTYESVSPADIKCSLGDVSSMAGYSAISSTPVVSYNVRIGHLRGQSITGITSLKFFSVPLLPSGTTIDIMGRYA